MTTIKNNVTWEPGHRVVATGMPPLLKNDFFGEVASPWRTTDNDADYWSLTYNDTTIWIKKTEISNAFDVNADHVVGGPVGYPKQWGGQYLDRPSLLIVGNEVNGNILGATRAYQDKGVFFSTHDPEWFEVSSLSTSMLEFVKNSISFKCGDGFYDFTKHDRTIRLVIHRTYVTDKGVANQLSYPHHKDPVLGLGSKVPMLSVQRPPVYDPIMLRNFELAPKKFIMFSLEVCNGNPWVAGMVCVNEWDIVSTQYFYLLEGIVIAMGHGHKVDVKRCISYDDCRQILRDYADDGYLIYSHNPAKEFIFLNELYNQERPLAKSRWGEKRFWRDNGFIVHEFKSARYQALYTYYKDIIPLEFFGLSEKTRNYMFGNPNSHMPCVDAIIFVWHWHSVTEWILSGLRAVGLWKRYYDDYLAEPRALQFNNTYFDDRFARCMVKQGVIFSGPLAKVFRRVVKTVFYFVDKAASKEADGSVNAGYVRGVGQPAWAGSGKIQKVMTIDPRRTLKFTKLVFWDRIKAEDVVEHAIVAYLAHNLPKTLLTRDEQTAKVLALRASLHILDGTTFFRMVNDFGNVLVFYGDDCVVIELWDKYPRRSHKHRRKVEELKITVNTWWTRAPTFIGLRPNVAECVLNVRDEG